MKKTYNKPSTPKKNQRQTKFNHLNQTISREFQQQWPNDRQIKIVCPNCEFHFKIQLSPFSMNEAKTEEEIKAYKMANLQAPMRNTSLYLQTPVKNPNASLQNLIDKQYSLISHYSYMGNLIQNSPIVPHKKSTNLQNILKAEGLERLKNLNEISQFQRSRMDLHNPNAEQPKIFLDQSRGTVRFNPSQKDSPIQGFVLSQSPSEKHELNSSNLQDKQQRFNKQVSRKLQEHKRQHNLNENQRHQLSKQIYRRFEIQQLLHLLYDWVLASQQHSLLPSYLKMMVTDWRQKTMR